MTFVLLRRAHGPACDVLHETHGAWHVPAGPCEVLVPDWVPGALPQDEVIAADPPGDRPRKTASKETRDAR